MRHSIRCTFAFLAVLFLFGCAVKAPVGLPAFTAKPFDSDRYQSKVDNFVIVLDASSSMGHDYNGNPKFLIAKGIAERLNQTIPELNQMAGFRSFGHDSSVSQNHTEKFYGMETYATDAMAKGIAKVTKAGGTSPLGAAMTGVNKDLEGLSGTRNAVVIISDGLDMEAGIEEVKALKNTYGDTLCLYPIQVGNDPKGTAFLTIVARIGGCGFLTSADELLAGDGMTDFVEKVFLAGKDVKPAPAPKVRKDSDGDGVYDDQDQCPNTPKGAKVNAVGCWSLENALFDFDKSVIKAEAYPLLDEVIDVLGKNPNMKVELQGHTDNIGTKVYNLGLSERRANAVAAYLIQNGIAKDRITTKGYGFSKPVALNSTAFGRSLNRRVEIHPY